LGLVIKAHRLVYHSTLGWRVIQKKVGAGRVWLQRRLGNPTPEAPGEKASTSRV